ncbi:MAG: EAL domain-containing protein [Chloroflexota bacterium]
MTHETVLVIDDSREIADFLAGKILPELGYQTLVAYSGKTALELIHKPQQAIDILLVDFQLPDMNGVDLLRRLTESGKVIPAILATAHGSEQIAIDAFRIGVQDYLKKPIDRDELAEALDRVATAGRLRREKQNLTTQLQQQVAWLRELAKVGQSVTSTLELDEVLRRIVEAGVQFAQAEEGFLALLEAQSERLYLRAVKNIDEEKSKTIRLPVNDSLIGSVMQLGRPLRTSQPTTGSPLKVATGYLVHSLLHVPIRSRGRTLGVLSVNNRISSRAFQETDETLLSSLADYAAIAIENAHLYHQAQEEIAQRKKIEQALRISEERYALAVRGANDGIWDWDLQSQKVYYSPRWKNMLGYKEDEVGDQIQEWVGRVHPDDRDRVQLELRAHVKGITSLFESEYRILHKDGKYRWMLSRGLAVTETHPLNLPGRILRVAGSQTDISLRKQAEEKLIHDAFHDTLTGLPNRALLLDHLRYAVERAKHRTNYLFAVLFIDLDRFKDINDSLGHALGDELLCAFGKLLLSMVRPTDTVARLGGDEFVILLEDIGTIRDATLVAERLQNELHTTGLLGRQQPRPTASIGIVISTTGYLRPEDVLRDADIAMYRAKSMGKARYELFDPEMRARIMARIKLESDLSQAIARDELRVNYQPILSIQNGRVTGFEALLRWQHPQLGLLAPDSFIPLAEETGLVVQLDRWVLHQVCRQLKAWNEQYNFYPPLTVSTNLSGKQFGETGLVEFIQAVLHESQLPPACLKLEVTESAIIEDYETTVEILSRLQAIGVETRIDDFGKGYSSLSYLSKFPVNALKIDYLFVSDMARGGKHTEIVQAIVMLAHSLGLQVVAEGVETETQLSLLSGMGCENAQGYYISKPLAPEDIHQLLKTLRKTE